MRKKILFTGGSGLLSLNWASQICDGFDVFLGLHEKLIKLDGTTSIQISLENELDFSKSIEFVSPDLIVHTAGMTNVDSCERNPDLAIKINVETVKCVANVCLKQNIDLIFISTDHLFNGTNSFVTEDYPKSPVNWYGKSKSIGEDYIKLNLPNALIIRTNFFGWGTSYRQSFSDFIINNLLDGKQITLFEDVYYTPILIEILVEKVMRLYQEKRSGVYNVVGNERISKYEFGMKLAKIFNLNTDLIIKGKIGEKTELVLRPKDLSLSNQKLIIALVDSIPSLENQIKLLKKQKKGCIQNQLQIY